MQHTYHIHIKGLVQGVGFRPFVCRLAAEMKVNGWVSNTNEGVIIEINSVQNESRVFYERLISSPPPNAIITAHSIKKTGSKLFTRFSIQQSTTDKAPDLLLTPDIAICNECREEIKDDTNRRKGYAFTTCLNCGPRYSIIQSLPYDRENTTMHELEMCSSCSSEYNDIHNRRHYSQTNSCKDCAVQMHLYQSKNEELDYTDDEIIRSVTDALINGKIAAVKGIGGYLLLCDATNETAITHLRNRKQRPSKPFAILYPNIEMAGEDVQLRSFEKEALQSKASPIVLCRNNFRSENKICKELIAPGLDKMGVLLPYSPLLQIITSYVNRPLIATSANLSGSPIIYKDEDALENLFDVADIILTYDREILVPQDDSVLQFTEDGQKIILRRSRGLAPNYFPNPIEDNTETILATGGELKSAFALLYKNKLYVSQFLGDQGSIESQEAYSHTLQHITRLLKATPDKILIDKHPAYFVAEKGETLAKEYGIDKVWEVQHHKAHFGAVLAENNLLHTEDPVLGCIWDGTGYGDDKQIWGGEFFIYRDDEMIRVGHLGYFPQLLGDKMSKEPRLSALSLLKDFDDQQEILRSYFSETEWPYYQKLLQKEDHLLTSSMGRFLDGIACILGLAKYNSYEGEAAILLECLARSCPYKTFDHYPLPLINDSLNWQEFMAEFLDDIERKEVSSHIAWKVLYSLARAVAQLCAHFSVTQVAFSGGVFQNALLNDLINEQLPADTQAWFHQQLSPNDECIGVGQLACYEMALYQKENADSKENVIAL
jgi:hydrogenase maturation protein HypF